MPIVYRVFLVSSCISPSPGFRHTEISPLYLSAVTASGFKFNQRLRRSRLENLLRAWKGPGLLLSQQLVGSAILFRRANTFP